MVLIPHMTDSTMSPNREASATVSIESNFSSCLDRIDIDAQDVEA
jgi:hypothetical protein